MHRQEYEWQQSHLISTIYLFLAVSELFLGQIENMGRFWGDFQYAPKICPPSKSVVEAMTVIHIELSFILVTVIWKCVSNPQPCDCCHCLVSWWYAILPHCTPRWAFSSVKRTDEVSVSCTVKDVCESLSLSALQAIAFHVPWLIELDWIDDCGLWDVSPGSISNLLHSSMSILWNWNRR